MLYPEKKGARRFPPLGIARALLLFSLLIPSCTGRQPARPELTIAVAVLPSEQRPYTAILRSFTEEAGIPVRLVAQQYGQIRATLEAEARAGRGELDVVELDVYLLPLVRQWMQPLDSLLTVAGELESAVHADAWSAGVFGTAPAALYFIPHRLNWQALIYDAAAIPVPPDDWDALAAVAALNPGKIGFKLARYEGLVCDVFPFVWQAGGDPLQPAGPGSLAAVRFLRSLAGRLNVSARSYKENSILQAQEHNEILLHPNWPFVVPLLRQKGLLGKRLKTAPLPRGPAGRATVLGGGYLGIPSTAPHPEEAARLLGYLASQETQRRLVAELGWFPMREEGWEGMTERDREDFAGFLDMRQAVRARPGIDGYEHVSRIWQEGVYRIMFEGRPADEVVEEMHRRIDELMAAEGK